MITAAYIDPPDRWWVTLPPSDLGPAVKAQYKRFVEELQRRRRLERIREADAAYYNEQPTIDFGGEQGETVLAKVNHLRSLVTGILSMTTASRPAFDASAADDSSEAAEHVQVAQQILDYHLDEGLEDDFSLAAWRMLMHSEAAVAVLWDATAGEVVAAMPGAPGPDGMPGPDVPVRAGELRVETYSPYDVARDLAVKSLKALPWVILRRRFSKWDLLARYPEAQTEILGQKGCYDDDWALGLPHERPSPYKTDQVYVLELYVAKCAAVPEGVYARVIGDRWLEGGPLPYDAMPIVVRSPDPKRDQALGSTQCWDLLALQALIDAAECSMATVMDAFGKGNIVTAKGADLEVADIGGGMQELKYQAQQDAREPYALELPRVEESDLAYVDHMRTNMQVLIGMNDTVRGDPGANLKAGVSLAMMQAVAVQYMSRFQAAYAQLVRQVGTMIIKTYQRYATTERVIEVSGVDEQRTAASFTADNIRSVRSIRVDLGNGLTRTTAGKVEMADALADPNKFPADPPLTREQYIMVRETGRLEPITRAPRSSALSIRAECDALAKGEQVQALLTDRHAEHIAEHIALLDGRQRMALPPDRIAAISEHIAEHEMLWVQLTLQHPQLLAATGQAPAPMPQMPAAPPPANDNGSAPRAGAPRAGAPANDNGGGPPMQAPPIPGAGPSPGQLPQLPEVPGTGQAPPMQGPAAGGGVAA